jgi:hypothetical protein
MEPQATSKFTNRWVKPATDHQQPIASTVRCRSSRRSRQHVFPDIRLASTMVVVAGLLDPRWLVEIDVDALIT